MNIDGDRPADMAALAALAFGPRPSIATIGTATRHLAFLPIEALELDLSDPEQRDFGDYELLERLGSGGMGVVYRARQKSLDREVAVKLLSAGPWASADFIERFRREAQSAARLEHPNIVAIHEIGSCDELNYFSMALVRGPNLALQLERDGPLPARRAAQLMRTIAEALHYAHRLGVLHLDLKPGNILIDGKGEPQIADFGLARRIDSTMTVAGDEISGTPGYMAPEQIELERAKLSPVTDVYGLGAIFYELLTGHPPFEAPTAREALALALNDAIHRPRNSRTDIPADLEAICLKCLAREPGERYPSAQALADDLHRFLEGQPVSVRPLSAPQRLLRWTRREPKLAISASAAALALLTGILATSLQWWRAEANAVAAREQTWAARADAAWRLVRDGHPYDATPALLANLRERESHGDAAGADLERLRLGTLVRGNVRWIDAVAIGRPGYAVAFDHAGDRLAVSSGDGDVSLLSVGDGRELWRVGTRNASHMWLTSPVYRVGFTRDGHHLIVDRGEPAPVTHPSGQDNILIDATNGHVMLPPAERFADFRDATYGSDGRFALLRNNQNQVQLFRVDGWMPMTPLQRAEPVNGAWMIGDGGRFIACALPGVVQLMDLRDLTVDHVVHTAVGTALLQAWAAQPDGRLLALGDIDGSVRLLDTQRLSLRELKPSPYAAVKWLSFSADGRWLAAATGDRAFIWDVATGSGGALPAGRYSATRVEVDSDSSTVLVVHPPEAIVWHLPAGTAGADDMGTRVASARTLVAQLPIGASAEGHAASHAPAWRLAASVDVDGQVRLWRWHRDPLLRARVAPQTTVDLHFDGHHVVAVDGREVRVIDVEGERTVSPVFVHPQSVSLAALAPDDRSLVTVSGRQIRVFDWRTGHLRFAPITMVDSPLRLAIARRSSVLLASTGAYRGGRFHELLSTFDLHTGRRLADAVAVPGPLGGLRFSPDGSRVISWRHGELSVRDATTLDRIANDLRLGPDSVEALRATYAAGWHPEAATQAARVGTPIVDAIMDGTNSRLIVLTKSSEFADAGAVEFDLRDGNMLSSHDFGKHQPVGLIMRGNGYESVVWTPLGPRWFESGAGKDIERPLPQVPASLLAAQDVSEDGRWLASASRQGVVVAERRGGQWATAPLSVPLPVDDRIVQLAFAPDAGSLLARSQHGRWLWWALSRDTRPTAVLDTRFAQLQADAAAQAESVPSATTANERAALRAGDRPPKRARAAQAKPRRESDAASEMAPPGFAFVDLDPAANLPVGTANAVFDDMIGVYNALPTGVQRYLGVDYRIHRMVAVAMPVHSNLGPPVSRQIPVPATRFSGIHVLAGGCCMLQDMSGLLRAPYAYLDIAYSDGGHARVPIVYGRDVFEPWTDPGDSLPARIAWVETGVQADVSPKVRFRLYSMRLENPFPQREAVGISFAVSNNAWAGLHVFAATLELNTPERAPDPVIRVASRTGPATTPATPPSPTHHPLR